MLQYSWFPSPNFISTTLIEDCLQEFLLFIPVLNIIIIPSQLVLNVQLQKIYLVVFLVKMKIFLMDFSQKTTNASPIITSVKMKVFIKVPTRLPIVIFFLMEFIILPPAAIIYFNQVPLLVLILKFIIFITFIHNFILK